jgi:hypothetical protein
MSVVCAFVEPAYHATIQTTCYNHSYTNTTLWLERVLNNTNTTECPPEANMPFRPTNGFMEPTRHVTYYEDTRTQVQDEHDPIEARTFDLCEDSSEEDGDKSQPKHKRKNAQHITSYGSIRKPTCKNPVNPTRP